MFRFSIFVSHYVFCQGNDPVMERITAEGSDNETEAENRKEAG